LVKQHRRPFFQRLSAGQWGACVPLPVPGRGGKFRRKPKFPGRGLCDESRIEPLFAPDAQSSLVCGKLNCQAVAVHCSLFTVRCSLPEPIAKLQFDNRRSLQTSPPATPGVAAPLPDAGRGEKTPWRARVAERSCTAGEIAFAVVKQHRMPFLQRRSACQCGACLPLPVPGRGRKFRRKPKFPGRGLCDQQ